MKNICFYFLKKYLSNPLPRLPLPWLLSGHNYPPTPSSVRYAGNKGRGGHGFGCCHCCECGLNYRKNQAEGQGGTGKFAEWSEWSAWKLENIFVRSAHFFAGLNTHVILS